MKLIKRFSAGLASLILVTSVANSQQVALLDSGVDPDAGLNLAPGFNYFENTDDTSDVSDDEHGTTSARLIAESFSGQIVPFIATNAESDSQAQSRVARDNALSDILGRDNIRVIAITRGAIGVVDSSSPLISQLSNADKVIAILSGNDFAAQPNALATSSFNLSGVIIVGGTDFDGTLLPQTNRAGTTQDKFVTAIGLPAEGEEGGTSFATARIAGIAGAVLQQNPDLTAAEVVDVILQSAEDRGEAGTDSEFGRGFILDADQVLSNVIGPVTVPTTPEPVNTGGGGGGGGGAALLVGGALAGVLLLMKKPSTKLEKTLVLDSYGRTFQVDLGKHVVINDGILHLNDFFNSLQQDSVSGGIVLSNLHTQIEFGAFARKSYGFDDLDNFFTPNDEFNLDHQADISFVVSSQLSQSVDLTAGYQISPDRVYGGAANLESDAVFGSSSFITGQSFGSVLSGFSPQAETLSFNYSPKKFSKASLKLGLVSVNQAQQFGQDTFSTLLQAGYQFTDNAGVSMQFGQIEENRSLLGGAAGGIFGVNSATTYAVNLAGHIKATDRVSIVANYGIGHTRVDASDTSLLKDFSGLGSDWYSLGVVGNDVFREQDQLGFAFSQPLKINSGSVNYSIPTGRNLSGSIAFDTERVNLGETNATEHAFETYYRTMLSPKMELGSFLSYRQNPNHVSGLGNEVLVMATLRYRQ